MAIRKEARSKVGKEVDASTPTAKDIAESRTLTELATMPPSLRRGSSSWHQRVAERAYALWLAEGRPECRAEQHWSQAELDLAADRIAVAGGDVADTGGDAVKAFGTKS